MSSNYKRPGVSTTERSNWESTHTSVSNTSGDWDQAILDVAYLSGAIDQENLWDLNGTTITPSTATNTVTLPYLSGTNDTVTVTTSSGLFQDTTVTISEGVTGGSLINVQEFNIDPSTINLVTGDTWITDSPSTSGKLLKYWDGSDIFSVELNK